MDFTWDGSLSVGDDEIDLQHKIFISLIETVINNSAEVEKVLDELRMYAKFHFSYEEEYWRENEISGLEEHIAEHETFIRDLKSMKDKHALGILSRVDLGARLVDWLMYHILETDLQINEE